MRWFLRLALIALYVSLTATTAVRASEDQGTPGDQFEASILPYLNKYCIRCHRPGNDDTEFRIDNLSRDVSAGPHAKQWAHVVDMIRAGEMPPEDEKPQPPTKESARIATWLSARLPKPDGATKHWAFQPLKRSARDSIDSLIDEKLHAAGLRRSKTAEPRRLLRRLYLDLTGVPPTTSQSDAFASDPSPANYEAVVDSLLASPRYGERWARHWLDLARYADSNGLHEDSDRPHAWRYRDYVIDSFNDDKPYGQFVREQIAGDEIDPKDPEAWIATGFCRNGPSNEENVAKAELESYRLDQLDDILATTSQAFLGQSIACARCHNHKLEPLTLIDYYQLLAVFDNTVPAYVPFKDGAMGKPKLMSMRARDRRKPPKELNIRALTDIGKNGRLTRALLRGNPQSPGDVVKAGIPNVLRTIPVKFEVQATPTTSGRRAALAEWIASRDNPLTWRVIANRIWQHHFGRGIVSTPSNFGVSGQPPSHPELLDLLAHDLRASGGRLKSLHKQIALSETYQQSSGYREDAARVDPGSKFIWRYPPHRMEAEAIRDSILATSGNLNTKMGGRGIKPRLPVALLEQSKRNEWPKISKENATHWRRSVYIYRKRQLPMPLLSLFDAPDASQSCAARFASTTPTQALVLLNDEFVNEQARYLAERVLAESPAHPARAMIERAYALPAADQQVAEAEAFVARRMKTRKSQKDGQVRALADLAVVLFNSSQFVYID